MVAPNAADGADASSTWRFDLPCNEQTTRRAQYGVALVLLGWHLATFLDTAMLLVENVTAQAIAGSSASDLRVGLDRRDRGVVRISVSDRGPSVGAVATTRRDLDDGLVGRLACDWGVDHHDNVRTVWFDIEG